MYFIFHLKKILFRPKLRVRANFGWRIRFRHQNWPSYQFRGRMVQIMGFWPILTVFWPGRQKFKSRILRVECFLGAIKKSSFFISLENSHINFEPNRTKCESYGLVQVQIFPIFRGVRPHEFLVKNWIFKNTLKTMFYGKLSGLIVFRMSK